MSTNQLNSAAKTIFRAFSTSALVFSVLFFNFPLSANAVTQDISYTINDNGGPVVGYYNVKDSGNKVFNWNVDVNFNGPGGMHVVTIGAYDEQAGSAATTKHPFGVSSSGKVDYRNAPESGSFSFSYDTARDSRLGQCGRVQIDGSFINETSPTYDDSNLFFAMVIDYGVDCVAPPANTAPVITLLGSNPVNMTVGGTYVDAGATAHDQEDGNITANIHKTGTVNTSVAGTYTITYNVSDSAGLAATPVTRTVNVNPAPVNHPPVITLVGSTPVNITVGSLYVDQGATALDQEDGNITANIQKTGTVNTAVVGTYIITYNVSDSKGLAAVPVTRTVNVVPAPVNNRPVITLVGSSTINIIAGALYVDQGATATDVEDGNITANIQKTGVVNTSVVGTYTVTYNVSDSQGLAAIPVTRTVIVIPANQRPVITLIGLNPISVTIGSAYTDPGATAQDFEDGDITAHIVATSTVNTAVLGAYTVTYNVSDSDGLAAIPVARTVNVVPLAPTVTLNANPINVPYGQSTTLTWVSTDATSCIATGDWSGSKTLSGNEVISNLILNETFIITCTGISGSASSTASVIVGPQISDISVLKVADKTTLNVGDTVTYTITVSNAGPNNATGVTATDLLSDKLNFVSASTTSGSYATSTGVWTIGHLNNSTSTVLTLVATVKSGNEGAIINNSVTSSSDQQDPNSGNNTSGVDVTVNHAANQRPVITLIGANPATVTVGQAYLDPGATAQDYEDGDITAHIVATSTVNTAVVGTYTITYNVSDSDGLAAVPVSRTVNVLEDTTVTPKGQITFCLVLANDQNTIATSSAGLPAGIFDINLSTSTDINSNVLTSKSWNTSAFAPNTKLILQENDADCVTHSNLELGTYYYSSTTNNGSRWNVAKYNDKYNQAINNVFDFFSYSPELFTATTTDDSLRNMNADGQIVLTAQNNNQSINLYSTYNPAPQCLLPEITSPLVASVTVNTPFTYTLTASSTTNILDIATSTLPLGLSYATSTGIISGTPTQTGVFNISLSAANVCGTTTAVLILTVNPPVASPSANLSIVKTVDRATANVGDAVTYTIIVTNTGSSTATNVIATESFPSLLNFVSATSTTGSYATSTNIWTIGSLANGSTTTLTLVGTVKAGSESQTITNSVHVTSDTTDPDTTNNTSTTTTTVNPAPCTSCGGGGGGSSSNLSVTKVADKASIGVGETLTYTVTVINNGPDNATGVSLTEVFPSKLTLVSATSTLGSYSTTTSIWTIGNLLNGSSTTLTLIGTVNAGTEGQTITNSVSVFASQTDPNGSNNTTSVNTNVNPAVVPPCTNCGGGGGGGGGGNGPIVGSYGGTNGPVIPQVAGATEVKACYYLYDYLRKDFINNPVEVTKLQVFLRDLEGFNDIQVTGVYDDQTIIALNAFQWRYRDDVLTPWGHTAPTSYTYILTKKKVNEIYCKIAFPVNAQQQEEIDNYRNFLLSLRNAGITIPENVSNPSSGTTTAPVPAIEGAVGSIKPATSTVSAGLTTLAGVSSTTQRIAGSLTATVFLAGKRVVNAIVSMFKWPFESIVNPVNQCVRGLAIFGWINILLLVIIIIISYFWYKEYKNNRIIEDVNKEIDLN